MNGGHEQKVRKRDEKPNAQEEGRTRAGAEEQGADEVEPLGNLVGLMAMMKKRLKSKEMESKRARKRTEEWRGEKRTKQKKEVKLIEEEDEEQRAGAVHQKRRRPCC